MGLVPHDPVYHLSPGGKGVSENIRVRSIVGRFLEHMRVYCFGVDDEREVYLSSADWMDRNLFRRVEACFPVRDVVLAKRVYREAITNYLNDNTQAWELTSDGSYRKFKGRGKPHTAQGALMMELTEHA